MQLRKRPRRITLVDMTPLIDVVFLMLIFFMVSTSFSTVSSLKLELPVSGSEAQANTAKNVLVAINAKGEFYVQHERVDDKDLYRRILGVSKGDPNMPVVLQADAQTTHQRVVKVLDTLRQLKMGHVAIATVHSEN